MNTPITLCDRCTSVPGCLLDYDGVLCRKLRDVQPTQADCLRSKTDEELAEWIVSIGPVNCPDDYYPGGYDCQLDCPKCWKMWLKSKNENG